MNTLHQKATAHTSAHSLLTPNDTVTVALSGGADSVALLIWLCDVKEQYHLTVNACHINHMARGDESDGDEAFVRTLCEKLAVPLTVYKEDAKQYAKDRGLSFEEGARNLRYELFERLTCDKVATAHTLDDCAETFIINMFRGSGIDGLCGIPPRRGRVVRPFLTVSRDEVLEYLAEKGQDYREDSTNSSDIYLRNLIRHRVLPPITERNPSALQNLHRTMQNLTADRDIVHEENEKTLGQVTKGVDLLSRQALLKLPQNRRERLLHKLLTDKGFATSTARVKLMDSGMQSGDFTLQIAKGEYFTVKGDDVLFVSRIREEESEFAPLFISTQELRSGTEQMYQLSETMKVSVSPITANNNMKNVHKYYNIFVIDCDKINLGFTLRPPMQKDRLKLSGRGVTKTMKNLLSEQKGTVKKSDLIVAALEDGTLVFAEHFGVSELFAVGDSTDVKNAVTIKILREDKKV